jgi:hypothetical protein
MGDRQFAPNVYVAMKADFGAWVLARFGYQKVAAGFTRVGQQAISDYCNVSTADFVPSDVLVDLMKATGDAGPLRMLAELVGHVVTPLPSVVRSGEPLGRISGKVMKETGDVLGRYGEMVDTGVLIDVETSRYLHKEIREAIEALVLMDLQVEEHAKAAGARR